ncbi:hypothetical protein BKA57DRAFT_532681 [Linnemannia elongata]|nr:hypothetical protein BKA57DRAFT_532681 [Linnemannia elongata]
MQARPCGGGLAFEGRNGEKIGVEELRSMLADPPYPGGERVELKEPAKLIDSGLSAGGAATWKRKVWSLSNLRPQPPSSEIYVNDDDILREYLELAPPTFPYMTSLHAVGRVTEDDLIVDLIRRCTGGLKRLVCEVFFAKEAPSAVSRFSGCSAQLQSSVHRRASIFNARSTHSWDDCGMALLHGLKNLRLVDLVHMIVGFGDEERQWVEEFWPKATVMSDDFGRLYFDSDLSVEGAIHRRVSTSSTTVSLTPSSSCL